LVERLHTDPAAYLELIKLAVANQSESAELIPAAVASARHAGCTWEQISDSLGISAQAAQQQYDDPKPSTEPRTTESMILAPLTAFSEMAVLARAGKYGWHATGYGVLYFTVARDSRQWEHARTVLTQPAGSGWQPIGGGWMWWRYWARPLDAPALPGNPSAADLMANNLPV